MLVLSRRIDEQILIGDDIIITVVRIGEHEIKLGIEAPRQVRILRDDAVLKSRFIEKEWEKS